VRDQLPKEVALRSKVSSG